MNKLFVILFLLLISSCSVFNILKPNIYVPEQENLIDSVYAKTANFETLSFRFVAKYSDNENNLSLYGSTKIIRDSVLYIKISLGLGITVAEIYATPDSFIIYFPIKNNYLAGNSLLLLDYYGIPLDFSSFQNILIARFFPYPYFIDINNYAFGFDNADSTYFFKNIVYNKSEPDKIDVEHNFLINESFLVEQFHINDYVLYQDLVCKYSKFSSYDNIFFPSNLDLTLLSIDPFHLNLINKKVIFNEDIDINFIIPENAENITY